jgi:hypothetical protein
MYTIKRGVAVFMSVEIEKILEVLCSVFDAFKLPVVITSGLDGPHRSDSLHYKFRAIDIRTEHLESEYLEMFLYHADDILAMMKFEFEKKKYPVQVLMETDHLHIEWDAELHNAISKVAT